jgi:phage I-like protein
MTLIKNTIGLMFGAAMSYYMFTLAGGIPISLNWNNKHDDEDIQDEYQYIDIHDAQGYRVE